VALIAPQFYLSCQKARSRKHFIPISEHLRSPFKIADGGWVKPDSAIRKYPKTITCYTAFMSRARSRQYLTVLEEVVVMSSITYENVLEYLETLSEEEQQEVFDLVKKRRIERRRSEIADNARKTFKAMEKGTAKRGSLEEIKSYLLADEEE
jgi:hypothetical protein